VRNGNFEAWNSNRPLCQVAIFPQDAAILVAHGLQFAALFVIVIHRLDTTASRRNLILVQQRKSPLIRVNSRSFAVKNVLGTILFISEPPVKTSAVVMSSKKRIPTDGGPALGHNPFGALLSEGLPATGDLPAMADMSHAGVSAKPAKKNRGRVDIIRQTAGRGGKTVTVVTGFVGIGLPEKEHLAKAMQRACGTGGTVKDGRIEIQGDKRTEVARILTEANFRPVFAGG
jgi:translation initiation factor 1